MEHNKNDNEIILFGRNMFINEVREFIPSLIDKFHTIACNQFVNSFENVENVIFFDDIAPIKSVKPHHNIITDIRLIRNKNARCYEWLKKHQKKELYLIDHQQYFSRSGRHLAFFFHTPSMALNWCYQKGFKTVYLCGVEISEDTRHFDVNYNACWTDRKRLQARKILEKEYTKHLNIIQLDKKSTLDLKKTDIKELLI